MSTTSAIGSTGTTGAATTTPTSSADKFNLKTEDFINMMVTQLQNQDPMEPAKNEELLAQMSQIGQLQSSTQLQDTLKSLMTQSQISSAGGLIGKKVGGTLADGKTLVSGTVTSVQVLNGSVNLQLDSGYAMPLSNVQGIADGAGATSTAGAATTAAAAA